MPNRPSMMDDEHGEIGWWWRKKGHDPKNQHSTQGCDVAWVLGTLDRRHRRALDNDGIRSVRCLLQVTPSSPICLLRQQQQCLVVMLVTVMVQWVRRVNVVTQGRIRYVNVSRVEVGRLGVWVCDNHVSVCR